MRQFDPAFPQQPVFTDRGRGCEWADGWGYGGMTMRDWFAGQALQGLLASCRADNHSYTVADNCKIAVKYADALLVELTKEP